MNQKCQAGSDQRGEPRTSLSSSDGAPRVGAGHQRDRADPDDGRHRDPGGRPEDAAEAVVGVVAGEVEAREVGARDGQQGVGPAEDREQVGVGADDEDDRDRAQHDAGLDPRPHDREGRSEASPARSAIERAGQSGGTR